MTQPTDDKPKLHSSDCSLHNGPAMEPKPCDCGADPSMAPKEYGSEYPDHTALINELVGALKMITRSTEYSCMINDEQEQIERVLTKAKAAGFGGGV